MLGNDVVRWGIWYLPPRPFLSLSLSLSLYLSNAHTRTRTNRPGGGTCLIMVLDRSGLGWGRFPARRISEERRGNPCRERLRHSSYFCTFALLFSALLCPTLCYSAPLYSTLLRSTPLLPTRTRATGLLVPVLLDSVALVVVALLVNNASPRWSYPTYWFVRQGICRRRHCRRCCCCCWRKRRRRRRGGDDEDDDDDDDDDALQREEGSERDAGPRHWWDV